VDVHGDLETVLLLLLLELLCDYVPVCLCHYAILLDGWNDFGWGVQGIVKM
jgi:hypothetical protein